MALVLVAVDNDMRDRRKRRAQLLDHVAAIVAPPGIGHAVACDQDFGLDLLEPVDDGGRGHIGRADAPDRADAGGGEKGDHGLRNIRQIGCDAIAGAHALRLQMDRQRGGLARSSGQLVSVSTPSSPLETIAGTPAACAASTCRITWRA